MFASVGEDGIDAIVCVRGNHQRLMQGAPEIEVVVTATPLGSDQLSERGTQEFGPRTGVVHRSNFLEIGQVSQCRVTRCSLQIQNGAGRAERREAIILPVSADETSIESDVRRRLRRYQGQFGTYEVFFLDSVGIGEQFCDLSRR